MCNSSATKAQRRSMDYKPLSKRVMSVDSCQLSVAKDEKGVNSIRDERIFYKFMLDISVCEYN